MGVLNSAQSSYIYLLQRSKWDAGAVAWLVVFNAYLKCSSDLYWSNLASVQTLYIKNHSNITMFAGWYSKKQKGTERYLCLVNVK